MCDLYVPDALTGRVFGQIEVVSIEKPLVGNRAAKARDRKIPVHVGQVVILVRLGP